MPDHAGNGLAAVVWVGYAGFLVAVAMLRDAASGDRKAGAGVEPGAENA